MSELVWDIDELLGDEEPHAALHDAKLLSFSVDYEASVADAVLLFSVGRMSDPEDRYRTRRGRLRLEGLMHLSLEPKQSDCHGGPPQITHHGPLDKEPEAEVLRELRERGETGVAFWVWFNNLNAEGRCAAKFARFEWL